MSIRVMIIDGEPDFRTLLMHHVTTCWDDAIISAYDPITAGQLPEEFSGAGNDLVLLGSEQGDRDPLQTLRQPHRRKPFPPLSPAAMTRFSTGRCAKPVRALRQSSTAASTGWLGSARATLPHAACISSNRRPTTGTSAMSGSPLRVAGAFFWNGPAADRASSFGRTVVL